MNLLSVLQPRSTLMKNEFAVICMIFVQLSYSKLVWLYYIPLCQVLTELKEVKRPTQPLGKC